MHLGLRRRGRYLEDATVGLLVEQGRESAANTLLRSLGCPDDEIPAALKGFHAAARKVLAQVIFG